jgi:tRNA(Arg) A34 adenosine deaminase TadA
MIKEADQTFLRAAIELAQRARQNGNQPFGALLVDPQGRVLLEAENTILTSRDITGHAETNLVRLAAQSFTPALLHGCTLYASTEPCPMCAAAIYWAGIGRVVYALSEAGLQELTRDNPANDFIFLPCREVLCRGLRRVEVQGPALEDEARLVHQDFWD